MEKFTQVSLGVLGRASVIEEKLLYVHKYVYIRFIVGYVLHAPSLHTGRIADPPL